MLQITINDKQYRGFIKYAISTCDLFSLLFEKKNTEDEIYFFQEFYFMIFDFIVKQNSIGYHPDSGTWFENSEINYCKCNDFTKHILQTANSIFDWNGHTLPEELCFYRNNQKWFVSICHEKYLFIYNETIEDVLFFNKEKIKYLKEI